MQRLPLKNIDETKIGKRVEITGGMLAGRSGEVIAVEDRPMPRQLLIELDRDGGNVWIHAAHLSIDVELNTVTYADRPEVLKNLASAAEEDMSLARTARDNEIIICQTHRGAVALRYDPASELYTLTTQDGGSWTTTGDAETIKTEIINLFDCIEGEDDEQQAAAA